MDRGSLLLLLLITLLTATGCNRAIPPSLPVSLPPPATRPDTPAGLPPPVPMPALLALCPAPAGWAADPPEHTAEHDLQTWLSPTRRTAYGVIAFHSWLLPLASDRLILDRFLQTMRATEGEASLVGPPQSDANLPGLRFVAEGGKYTVHGNLVSRGTRGWIVYAGTLRHQPIEPAELELAARAREQTVLGPVPATGPKE